MNDDASPSERTWSRAKCTGVVVAVAWAVVLAGCLVARDQRLASVSASPRTEERQGVSTGAPTSATVGAGTASTAAPAMPPLVLAKILEPGARLEMYMWSDGEQLQDYSMVRIFERHPPSRRHLPSTKSAPPIRESNGYYWEDLDGFATPASLASQMSSSAAALRDGQRVIASSKPGETYLDFLRRIEVQGIIVIAEPDPGNEARFVVRWMRDQPLHGPATAAPVFIDVLFERGLEGLISTSKSSVHALDQRSLHALTQRPAPAPHETWSESHRTIAASGPGESLDAFLARIGWEEKAP